LADAGGPAEEQAQVRRAGFPRSVYLLGGFLLLVRPPQLR